MRDKMASLLPDTEKNEHVLAPSLRGLIIDVCV